VDAETIARQLVDQPVASPESARSSAYNNAAALERELEWLAQFLNHRLTHYFKPDNDNLSPPSSNEGHIDFTQLPPPQLGNSNFGHFIDRHQLNTPERLILILTLTPYIRPQLFDVLLTKNGDTQRGFTEFGGHLGNQHGGLLPTVETALFLFAGDDLEQRFQLTATLSRDSRLVRQGIIHINETSPNEPWPSSALQLERALVEHLTSGNHYRPEFGVEFPARCIQTRLDWDHLILPHSTLEQLDEIRHWILYGDKLLDDWGMRDKLSPGFTSLFYGAPGTGKTLSACLLGKYCQCDVYKVDLSMMVSKYIGETEKNLAKVFDAAEHRQWILFFDEADALFGKRTKVDDSRDRYANQEISFLLQRIEEFEGVVILASNFKSNIDDAFIRRFQSIVQFPIPKADERVRIWKNAFSSKITLEPALNLKKIAEKHDISGGTIMNVVRFASLRALARKDSQIWLEDIEEGIRREFLKEGRRL